MGKVNLTISDDLEKEFREVAYREKGMKKGFLTDATEEAIKVWLGYVKVKGKKSSENERLWPEEEGALDDIKDDKTKMVKESGEDFLKELNEIIDEQNQSTVVHRKTG
jgi:hypothetical protein